MLYPPYIEGTLPSFYGDSLTVPFSMNRSVGSGEVAGFSLKLKTIQNSKYIFTTSKVVEKDLNSEYYVKFDISDYTDKLYAGQHYKVQLAYIDTSGSIGYYSTVGIIKYTTKPSITIQDLRTGRVNASQYNYVGVYTQQIDTSEKEYKYRFIFSDSENKVLKDTDWQIHNSSIDDNSYSTQDEFTMPFELTKGTTYYLQYKVITNNNLEVSSPKYRIGQKTSIAADQNLILTATMNQDNGYVKLTLEGELESDTGEETALNGAFLITRACEDTNFTEWDEIYRFKAKGTYPSVWKYQDFTVAQGKDYIYSIQQYNDFDIYSERILSNTIFTDFEDIFLYDGEKQLKISYNPQVSSFKTDVLESKTETIGSKYPFFFRNGTVEYKEFSLNGLISYLSDEEHLFMTDAEMGLSPKVENMTRKTTVISGFEPDDQYFFEKQRVGVSTYILEQNYKDNAENHEILDSTRYRTTQLTSFNVSAERTFKLKVLEWLNNGKPKLFRSPTEGNYIVRLMNISLSPEDTLGRMLHNFSCTAYEIDDYTYDNLNTYGIISILSPELKVLRFKSVLVKDYLDKNMIDKDYAVTIKLENMRPGDIILIKSDDEDNGVEKTIVIGSTGNYQIETGTKISSVRLETITAEKYRNWTLNSPMLTYSYYDAATNVFNEINNITFEEVPAKQYIGEQTNIVAKLNNVKDTLINFYYLHFMKRDIKEVDNIKVQRYDNETSFHYSIDDEYLTNPYPLYKGTLSFLGDKTVLKYEEAEVDKQLFLDMLSINKPCFYIKTSKTTYELATYWDANATYYVLNEKIPVYIDLTLDSDILIISEEDYNYLKDYYDTMYLDAKFKIYDTRIAIDGNQLDLKDTGEYIIGASCEFDSIELTVGTVLECGYSIRTLSYIIESTNESLAKQKAELDELKANLLAQRNSENNAIDISTYVLKNQNYLLELEVAKKSEEA